VTSSRLRLAAALALALPAIALPWEALLDAAAARYNTVRGFRSGYEEGILWMRLALLVDAAAILLWPRLRARLWPEPAGPDVPRPQDRRDLAAAGALALLSLAFRLPGLAKSLQHDEWYIASLFVEHGPLIIATRATGFTNHILYTLFAWAGVKVFGMNEIGLRAAAAVFGALAPGLLYLVLRTRLPRLPSLAGAAALALSAFAVSYSQEARGYSLAVLGTVALFGLDDELRERPSLPALAAAVAVSVALVYTRLAYVVAVAAFVLAAAPDRPHLRRWLLVLVLSGLASLTLYAPTFGNILEVFRTGKAEPGAAPTYGSPFVLIHADFTTPYLPLAVMAAVGGLALAGIPSLPRPWILPCISLVGLSLLAFQLPWGNSRYQIHLLPIVMLLQASGLAWIAARSRPAALALGTLLLCAHAASLLRYHRQDKLDFKGAAAWLAPRSGRLGFAHDSKTAAWYLKQPERCVEVNADNLDAENPEWVSVHTITLWGQPDLEAKIRARYRREWERPSLFGHSLTLWRRRD
jgi:hypothetical protein